MSLFDFFRSRASAPVARERLKVLLAHERTFGGRSDLIEVLREDILAVISRHVTVEPGNVQVGMKCDSAVSTLKIDIEILASTDAPLVIGS